MEVVASFSTCHVSIMTALRIAASTITTVLVSSRNIAPGEEITISYTVTYEPRKEKLQRVYGFTCGCQVCTDPHTGMKFAKAQTFDEDLSNRQHLSRERIEQLVQGGMNMMKLYEELQLPPKRIVDTCAALLSACMELDQADGTLLRTRSRFAKNFVNLASPPHPEHLITSPRFPHGHYGANW
jgi:hypothetical protein